MTIWGALAELFHRRPPAEPDLDDTAPVVLGGPPWPDFDGGLDAIPIGRRGLVETFGDLGETFDSKGAIKVSRVWERASMTLARELPGYARPLYVHRLAEPYLREALRRATWVAPDWAPGKIGCFNPRRQRHSASLPLSLHSWGVAVDIDSDDNPGRNLRDRVEPWTGAWTRLYPRGLPREVVEAIESVGWEWGGRWFPYVDPMHFQLCRTRARPTLAEQAARLRSEAISGTPEPGR